ncbi:helicase-exonuclease AddAB subunit AddB [Konateibacter massiliensis]|uniref:helicase-exonuclease AddAB subunit AddB n=1 Tax=Konateibacter massiliensis TaxID=2002841 RepID=UPI000C15EABC|nr:helicase-exonuclease AddAB subunit AddB [Konateibacter massiliensis]
MSLQLLLGNSGSGKSYQLNQYLIEQSMANPDTNYIIIVPEQFTLQTQKDIVSMHPRHGVMNIDIVSFQRLAYRIFEETGGNSLASLDDTGKNLIIRKIASQKQPELRMLGANLKKLGYISEIKSVISELTQYNVEPNQLEQLIEETKNKPSLNYKLQDIHVLYKGFKEYLADKFITAEELLLVLSRVVKDSAIIQNSVIAIDGFTGFTPVQFVLLEELIKHCKKLMVSVTIDSREELNLKNEHELFYMSKKMILSLQKIAAETKVEMEEPIFMKEQVTCRHSGKTALGALEKRIFRYPVKKYEEEQEEIKIFTAKNPLAEIKAIAGEVLRLVREEGYRFQEIAVVSGDIAAYSSYAAKVFKQYDIPAFIDDKRSILMNSFVEFIRATLKMIEEDFSYDGVFRYLRCDMHPMEREDVDELENYCLAFGIRGRKKWEQKWVRTYDLIQEEKLLEINALRESLMETVLPLYEVLKAKDTTAKEMIRSLYDFVAKLNLQQKLGEMEREFEAAGELSLAKEYAQIYKIVLELFDRVVDLLGDEKLTAKEFREILDAGFEEAKVGIIPPSIDRVVFGDIERTRLDKIKVLFFAGVNEGIIPKNSNKGGIISQIEREALLQYDIELAPTNRQDVYTQKFYLYLNMTKPSEKLYLSYSKTDSQGGTLRASYLIGTVRKLFPRIAIEDKDEVLTSFEGVVCESNGLDYLTYCLRQVMLGNKPEGFLELYHWYNRQTDYETIIKSLGEAAYFHNHESKISKAVAKALYGSVLENSVTRLEKYAACAFAHFLTYGLELKERREYHFQAMDMGNIFHQVLELFAKRLLQSGYDWSSIPEEERNNLADLCVEECIIDYGNTVLYSSARNEYVIARIKRIVRRTLWALQNQMVKGKFSPSSYEISFSMADSLDSINIRLSEDERLKLKGRIDRMDLYEDDENVYVKIIDYKSGSTSFDMVALYYGLQLQLVVYLNAAVEMEQKLKPDKAVIPAGILYYNISDPVVDREEEDSEENIRQRILEKLKMNGLVNSDREIIRMMDDEMENKSSVLPVSFNKDGSLSRYSSAASTEHFHALSRFVDEKIKELGTEILEGNIEIAPYESGNRTACDYCTYKGICGFDLKSPGFEFRRLKQFSDDEIWEKIVKGEGE